MSFGQVIIVWSLNQIIQSGLTVCSSEMFIFVIINFLFYFLKALASHRLEILICVFLSTRKMILLFTWVCSTSPEPWDYLGILKMYFIYIYTCVFMCVHTQVCVLCLVCGDQRIIEEVNFLHHTCPRELKSSDLAAHAFIG